MARHAYFRLYVRDFRADTALHSCSYGARGLWLELVAIMHEAHPRGHLAIGRDRLGRGDVAKIALYTMGSEDDVSTFLDELLRHGALSLAPDGAIMSPTLLQRPFDHHRKNLWAASRRERVSLARLRGSHTAFEWQKLLDLCGRKCARCSSAAKLHKDHVIPLFYGGSEAIENLQPLCAACNHKKHVGSTDYIPAIIRAELRASLAQTIFMENRVGA